MYRQFHTQPFKFKKVRELIKAEILNGNIKKNEKVPTIATSSEKYSCSIVTVSRAYLHLRKHGYIYHEPGKGYFVR